MEPQASAYRSPKGDAIDNPIHPFGEGKNQAGSSERS